MKKTSFLLSYFIFVFIGMICGCRTLNKPVTKNRPISKSASYVVKKMKKITMPFIENRGQTSKEVAYYAKTFGGTVFVTKKGDLVYTLSAKKGSVVLKERFVNATVSEVKGEDKSITKVNYYKGKMKITNLSTYNYVNLGEIWKGIEVKIHAYGDKIEKIFYIKPGAKVGQIKARIEGADSLKVTKDGRLKVITPKGEIYFTKPIAYQKIKGKRKNIEVAYVIQKNTYTFKLGKYDPAKPIFIDPLLASTYLGGSGEEKALALAIDNYGDVYVAGYTNSTNFPFICQLGPCGVSNSR